MTKMAELKLHLQLLCRLIDLYACVTHDETVKVVNIR